MSKNLNSHNSTPTNNLDNDRFSINLSSNNKLNHHHLNMSKDKFIALEARLSKNLKMQDETKSPAKNFNHLNSLMRPELQQKDTSPKHQNSTDNLQNSHKTPTKQNSANAYELNKENLQENPAVSNKNTHNSNTSNSTQPANLGTPNHTKRNLTPGSNSTNLAASNGNQPKRRRKNVNTNRSNSVSSSSQLQSNNPNPNHQNHEPNQFVPLERGPSPRNLPGQYTHQHQPHQQHSHPMHAPSPHYITSSHPNSTQNNNPLNNSNNHNNHEIRVPTQVQTSNNTTPMNLEEYEKYKEYYIKHHENNMNYNESMEKISRFTNSNNVNNNTAATETTSFKVQNSVPKSSNYVTSQNNQLNNGSMNPQNHTHNPHNQYSYSHSTNLTASSSNNNPQNPPQNSTASANSNLDENNLNNNPGSTTPSNRKNQKFDEKSNRKITDFFGNDKINTPTYNNYNVNSSNNRPPSSNRKISNSDDTPIKQQNGPMNTNNNHNLADYSDNNLGHNTPNYQKSSHELFNNDINKSPPKITSEMLHTYGHTHIHVPRPTSRGKNKILNKQMSNNQRQNDELDNEIRELNQKNQHTLGPNGSNPSNFTSLELSNSNSRGAGSADQFSILKESRSVSTQTDMTNNTIERLIQQNSELDEYKTTLEEHRILGLRHREILLKNDMEKKKMLTALKNALIEQAKTERRHARDKVGRNRIRLGYLTRSNTFGTGHHAAMDSWTHGTWLEQLEIRKIKISNEKEAIEKEKKNLRLDFGNQAGTFTIVFRNDGQLYPKSLF